MKQFTCWMRQLKYRREKAARAAALAVGQVNKGLLAATNLTGSKEIERKQIPITKPSFKVLFRIGGVA